MLEDEGISLSSHIMDIKLQKKSSSNLKRLLLTAQSTGLEDANNASQFVILAAGLFPVSPPTDGPVINSDRELNLQTTKLKENIFPVATTAMNSDLIGFSIFVSDSGDEVAIRDLEDPIHITFPSTLFLQNST